MPAPEKTISVLLDAIGEIAGDHTPRQEKRDAIRRLAEDRGDTTNLEEFLSWFAQESE